MLQHDHADDWVVATGETRSVRQMCEYVFSKLGLDFYDHLRFDVRLKRPQEVPYLKGDSTKIRSILGWRPEYTFETMMDEIIDHWISVLDKR